MRIKNELASIENISNIKKNDANKKKTKKHTICDGFVEKKKNQRKKKRNDFHPTTKKVNTLIYYLEQQHLARGERAHRKASIRKIAIAKIYLSYNIP